MHTLAYVIRRETDVSHGGDLKPADLYEIAVPTPINPI